MRKQLLAIACVAAGALVWTGADGASNVVQYVYDAAGNIVAIQRIDPAPVPFTEIAPTTGPAAMPAVPPGGVAPADVIATARLSTDGPAQGLGLFVTGKYGWIAFDAAAGAWMSLHIGNFAVTPAEATISYTIYKPDNTQLATGTLSATNLSIHLPPLPTSGTYSLLLRTGIAQGSLDARLETNRFVPADGTTLAIARSAGQSTRALIAGVTGDQKALMVSGLVTVPAGNALDLTIALPNGSTFRRTGAAGLGTTTALPPFTMTGTHPVTLVPGTGTTQATFRIGLVGGVGVTVDGAPADVAIANPGEGARLTFAALAGENLGLGVSAVVLNSAAAAATNVSVYKPDASLLATVSCGLDGIRCASNLENLPVTGTYTIIVQPVAGATGTQRVWLSRDVSGTLTSGTPVNVAISRPGQNARLTFTAAAGALLAVQVRAVATNPPGQSLLAVARQSDRTTLAYMQLTAGQTLVMPPLPVAGAYTVFIEPDSATRGAATATMDVLLDPGQAIAIDGPTLDTTIGVAGGSARHLFAGIAGQNLGLGVSNLAFNPQSDATVTIYKPDGAQLAAFGCPAGSGGCGGNLTNLPLSGTYGLVVRPAGSATGGFSTTLSSDFIGALLVGGSQLLLNLDRPGRNGRLVFAATAGQTLRLTWSGAAIAGAPGNAIGWINAPSGVAVGTAQIAHGSSGTYDIPALPATGNYTVFVDPPRAATLSATFGLVVR